MENKDIINDLMNQKTKPSWQRYMEGDDNAASGALRELQPTIDSAIQSFAGNDPSYKTQARILALGAIRSFDPHKGASIKTHVYGNLQRLKRISAQRGNLTRVSEEAATQRVAIEKARRAWEIDHGNDPTTEELSTMTGISRERIDALSHYRPVTPDSLAVSPEGDSMAVSDVDKAMTMYDRFIYDELDRTDKKIYEWSTGYGGSKTLSRSEMAARLRMSEAAVSKRASKIAVKFNRDREMFRKEFTGAGY